MILNTSRVEIDQGIKFYEQDVLFDNYMYSGNTEIEVRLDYVNPGFGIALINSEGSTLSEKNEILMFKMGNKNLEVIYKNKDNLESMEKPIKANLNAAYAKCHTENLLFKICKYKNKYTIYVGNQEIGTFNAQCDLESFNIGYYSNKDNIIRDVSIASSIPYDWVVNMKNTNGGYIEFQKDGFIISECKNNAEVEQINIDLKADTYFLKFNKSDDSDIRCYIMNSNNDKINDNEKNILNSKKSFTLKTDSKVSLKFVGKKGSISDITITTLKDNSYIRTTPENGDYIEIEESYIKFNLDEVTKIKFDGTINFAPGEIHSNPIDYAILKIGPKHYGLNDLHISEGVKYFFKFENNILNIVTQNNNEIFSTFVDENTFTIFSNVNGIIQNLKIVDIDGGETDVTVQLTTKKSVPGLVKSPIIVLDENSQPLNISSSYRESEKNNKLYYLFTNTEREYFKPKNHIKLNSLPLNIVGSIIIYGIPHDATFDIEKIYKIKETKDTIDCCCNFYDVLYDDKDYGVNVNYTTGDISILGVDKYKCIIVDYLKENSYCINYKYEYNSYEVDISTSHKEGINVIYDNTEKKANTYEYINEQLYYDTDITPDKNCYIILGR